MNRKHRHITTIALLLCGLLGLVACSNDTPEFPDGGSDIFLTFRAAVAGASTRAGEGDANVNTLRIAIVSSTDGVAWKLEHNEQFSLTAQLPHEYSFKVAADSKKRIYLIANESGLVDGNGRPLDFADGKFVPQDGKAEVDDYVFDVLQQSYTSNALPMTAMYEIVVPTADQIVGGTYSTEETLYLVRAATKFTFEFTNESTTRDITVTGVDIQQVVTDQMYLMPHVNMDNGKYWVVEETKAGSEYQKKELEKDWLDWIGQEAEDSKTGVDSDWLTDYEIPPTAATPTTHSFTPFGSPSVMNKSETGEEPYLKFEAANAFYLPESKTLKAGDNAELKLQQYSITVHTTENGTPKDYPSIILPHLASLFRNTYVEVGATFRDGPPAIALNVDVHPWYEVKIDDVELSREKERE